MDSSHESKSGAWEVLTRRAIEDPDFRERLIDDPRTTIAEATGQDIPHDMEIVVVENGPTTFHIVLPSADLDLSEADVAGGWGSWWNPACACESPSPRFN